MGYFFKKSKFGFLGDKSDVILTLPKKTKRISKKKRKKSKRRRQIIRNYDGTSTLQTTNNKGIVQHIHINTGRQRSKGLRRKNPASISQIKGDVSSGSLLVPKKRDYPPNINNSRFYLSQYKIDKIEHRIDNQQKSLEKKYEDQFKLVKDMSDDSRLHQQALMTSTQAQMSDLRALNRGQLQTQQELIRDRTELTKQLEDSKRKMEMVGQFLRDKNQQTTTNLNGGIRTHNVPIQIQLLKDQKVLNNLNSKTIATNIQELEQLSEGQILTLSKQGALNKETIRVLAEEEKINSDTEAELLQVVDATKTELKQKIAMSRTIAEVQGEDVGYTRAGQNTTPRKKERTRATISTPFVGEPTYANSSGSEIRKRSARRRLLLATMTPSVPMMGEKLSPFSKVASKVLEGPRTIESESELSSGTSGIDRYVGRPLDDDTKRLLSTKFERDRVIDNTFPTQRMNKDKTYEAGSKVPLYETTNMLGEVIGLDDDTTQSDIEALGKKLNVSRIADTGEVKKANKFTKEVVKKSLEQQTEHFSKNFDVKKIFSNRATSRNISQITTQSGRVGKSRDMGLDPFVREENDKRVKQILEFRGRNTNDRVSEIRKYNDAINDVGEALESVFENNVPKKEQIKQAISNKSITPNVGYQINELRREQKAERLEQRVSLQPENLLIETLEDSGTSNSGTNDSSD